MKRFLLQLKLSGNAKNNRREYSGVSSYYTYILLCADDSYYTGVTNNLGRRVKKYNSSSDEESYTYCRKPVQLVYFERHKYILNAIVWEKQIKKWSRLKKDALIQNDSVRLKELSRCLNETTHTRDRSNS